MVLHWGTKKITDYKFYENAKSQSVLGGHTLNMLLNILGEGFTLDDIAEFTPDQHKDEKNDS